MQWLGAAQVTSNNPNQRWPEAGRSPGPSARWWYHLETIGHHGHSLMDLLPYMLNCGLCMRRECRERFRARWPRVTDPDMHHGTCVTHMPWCMPGSLTSGFLLSRWWGNRPRHSRRMHNPQFYVSGERLMARGTPSHAVPVADFHREPSDCTLWFHLSMTLVFHCSTSPFSHAMTHKGPLMWKSFQLQIPFPSRCGSRTGEQNGARKRRPRSLPLLTQHVSRYKLFYLM